METQTRKRATLKLMLVELLGGKCIDCGLMPHIVAMDFDHVDPSKKKYSMAQLLGRAASGESKHMEELMAEAKKCVLRCSNCHRIKTFVNREGGGNKPKTAKHRKKWLYQ